MDRIDEFLGILPWVLVALGALIAVARILATRSEIGFLLRKLGPFFFYPRHAGQNKFKNDAAAGEVVDIPVKHYPLG